MTAKIAYEQEDAIVIEKLMQIMPDDIMPRGYQWTLVRAIQAQQRQIEKHQAALEMAIGISENLLKCVEELNGKK